MVGQDRIGMLKYSGNSVANMQSALACGHNQMSQEDNPDLQGDCGR